MFLFKRRWILTTLLVAVAAAVMVRLGFWQLARLAGKRAYIAQVTAALAAAPLALTGAETDLPADEYRNRPATAKGEYDFEHEVLLKNQFFGNQPGYDLLTPFRLEGSEQALLVDRGWVPLDAGAVGDLTAFQEVGKRQIEGRIEPADPRPRQAETIAGQQKEWYRVDLEGIQAQTPYALLPFYLALTPSDDHTGLPNRNPPEIILDEGPHLGYAFQWFLFALVVPIVYAVQVRRLDRRPGDGP